MERRANEEGRFILCSILDPEAKRFRLVFPERKAILGVGSLWLRSFVLLVLLPLLKARLAPFLQVIRLVRAV